MPASARRLSPQALRLVLVTDPELCRARGLCATVRAAVAGGVTLVQLRDKKASTREMIAQAQALTDLLTPLGIGLVVNDRPQVAAALAGCGLHLGQSDGAPAPARALLGPRAVIGLSIENAAQAQDYARHHAAVVDYIGLGPIHATARKPDHAPPLGCAAARSIAASCPAPAVAIGGITRENAAEVMTSGVQGLAVIAAICAAPDPQIAAQDLRRIVDHAWTTADYART